MRKINFLSKSSSRSCGHNVVTLASTVGSPSVHRRSTMLRLLSVLVLILTLGVGNVWGAEGDIIKEFDCNVSAANQNTYARQTPTCDGITWNVSWGQTSYIGTNKSDNYSKLKITNSTDLNAGKAVKSDITTSTQGYCAIIPQSTMANVGKITISCSALSGSPAVYVVSSNSLSSAYSQITLKTGSGLAAQGATMTTSGLTFEFDKKTTGTYYAIVLYSASWYRLTSTDIQFIEGASTPTCTEINPTLSYTSMSLSVGDDSSAPTLNKDGSTGGVTWTSSNTNVATVNSSGVVHAEGSGSATITATIAAAGGKCSGSATANFTVTNPTRTVNWVVNGKAWNNGVVAGNSSVESGSKISVMPTAPTSSNCDNTKEFVGWTATENYSNETTPPTDLFCTLAGSPEITVNKTFYAVFANASNDFQRITSANLSILRDGDKVAIVCVKNAGALKTDGSVADVPAETSSKITPNANIIWTIKGTSLSWTIENSSNQKLGTSTSGTPNSNKSKDAAVNASYNNTWLIQNSTNANNGFSGTDAIYISLTNSNTCALEINDSKWCVYNSSSASSNQYTALKFYRKIYTNYDTNCCTSLGSINGSISLSQSGSDLVASGWTATNDGNETGYLVKLYNNDQSSVITSGSTVGTAKTYTFENPGAGTYWVSVTPTYSGAGNYCASGDETFSAASIDISGKVVITFKKNGATGTDDQTQEVDYNTETALEDVSDRSYTAPSCKEFGGWASSEANATAGTVAYANGANITATEATTLWAIWKTKTFAVTDGTIASSVASHSYSVNTIACGSDLTITCAAAAAYKGNPTVTATGAHGAITVNSATSVTIANVQSAIAVSIAYNTPKETATVILHDATGAHTQDGSYYEMDNYTLPNTAATCTESELYGWYTETYVDQPTAPSGEKYIAKEGSKALVAGDNHFYAVYATIEDRYTNNYTKITSADELTNGDYLIAGISSYCMSNTVNVSNYMNESNMSSHLDDDVITNSSNNNIIWTITKDGDNYTFYNAAATGNKYLGLTTTSPVMQAEPHNFTVTLDGTCWVFSSVTTTGYKLAYSTYFKSLQAKGSDVLLYKRGKAPSAGAPYTTSPNCTTHDLTSAIDPISPVSGTVELGKETLVEGRTTTATATPSAHYTFSHWTISGTGAMLSDANANPVTVTMGTADAEITAHFTEKEKCTVEFYNNGGDAISSTTYWLGETPEAPTLTDGHDHDACDETSTTHYGWTQTAWTETLTKEQVDAKTAADVKVYAKAAALPAVAAGDNGKTIKYHAVWAQASGGGSTSVFSEGFSSCEGTGGNDDSWSGSIATTTLPTSISSSWSITAGNAAKGCIKLGAGSTTGHAITPFIDCGSATTATLTFRAGAWDNNDDGTTLTLSYTNCSGDKSSVTLAKGSFTEYTVNLSNITDDIKIDFYVSNGSKHRFFLDDVDVTCAGGTSYSAFLTTCIPSHSVSSAVSPEDKATVTLGANSVAEGSTTTAEYSAITAGYEFVNWTISGTGASLDDNTANPTTITMGTADVTVTANLQCVKPTFTVHPASANYVADPSAKATALSVTASAAGADLDYQWQSKVGEGEWTDISAQDGGTAATYTPSRTTAGETQYHVIVTNHVCSESRTSEAATITVTTPSACSTPTFTPAEGTYTGTTSVVLASETTGATVYFTLTTDGSEPTTPTSGSTAYSSAISVTENTHIKAIAIKDGMQASSVAEAEYIIKCVTPEISPAADTYTGTKSVTITCATDGATIYYTTDGSTPDNTKTEYKGAFDVTNNQTVKAIAIKSNMANSAVASAAYLIKCETPVISPAADTYTGAQDVTITCATGGATIYYTTDGTDPDNTKTEYTGSFKVTNSKTVKAIAIKSGMENSAIASAAYTIQHTITWSANGSTTTSTVTDGNKLVLPVSAPTSCDTENYGTFIGWYTTAAGSADDPSNAVSGTKADADHTPTGDETYYAVWANGDLVGGWQKATSIAVGDVVVFVHETASREMTSIALIGSNMCGNVTEYTTSPAGTYPLTIVAGSVNNSYAFQNGSNYLSYSGTGNTLSTSTDLNGASSWTINASADGNFKFANVTSDTRIMQFNNNSAQYRWACYTSDQTAFQIYKQTAGATGFISNCCEEWTATAKYGESNVINVNDVVAVTVTGTVHGTASYESDDTDVLTVASDGKITGKKAGSATVTISWAGADGYCAYETTVDVTVNGTITVTYNANDGSLTPETTSQNATSNSAFTLDANSFSRTGYTFQGWATTPSGDKEYNNSQADVEFAEDITLYAVWSINSHAVTLNQPTVEEVAAGTIKANGETSLPAVNYGTTVTLTATENDGYVFTGWSVTGATVVDANAKSTTFTMPDNAVSVSASYSTYTWVEATPFYSVTTAPKTTYNKLEKFSTAGVVIKENYKRSDNNEITKQETYTGAWTAKLNGVAIANGADLSLDDNNKTLKLYIGEDEIASYTLKVNDIVADLFIDGLWGETFTLMTGTYDMPTPQAHDAGSTDCQKHNTFAGWVLAAKAENPTVDDLVTTTTDVTAANNTYYAVWSKSEKVMKEITVSKNSFANSETGSSKVTFGTDISYTTQKNDGTTDPTINGNGELRLYQAGSGKTYGGSITIAAAEEMTLKKVDLTTGGDDYKYVEAEYTTSGLSGAQNVDNGHIVLDGLTNRYLTIINTSNSSSERLDISKIEVTYKKEVTETDYITDCDPRYDVEFLAGTGATGYYDKVTKKAGVEITLPDGSALSKDHHTFAGWYSAYYDVTYSESTSMTYTVPVDGDILEAQWTEDHFGTVTFKNGETTTSTIKVYDGGTYDLAAKLVLAGKEFIGWKWNGSMYTAGQANQHMTDPAEDRTYTAVWMPVIDVATADAADLSDGKWILVEKKSQLKAGDFIVIAAAGDNAALSKYQKTSNRGDAAVTKIADTLTYTSNVAPLFLQYDPENDYYAFYDRAYTTDPNVDPSQKGYLYAPNALKTQTGITMQGIWAIDIVNKKASIVAQGNNSDKIMRYNKGSNLFNCYGTATQSDIAIYKWAKNISSDMNVSDVTNTDIVIVKNDVTLTIDAAATLDNVIIEAGGEVSGTANLTVNNLTINSEAGASGQFTGTGAVTINGDLVLEIKLDDDLDASKYYCISAPFAVSAFEWGNGTPMVFNVDYQLFKYDGDKRARTGNGWQRVGATMDANTAYFIVFDNTNPNNQNVIRLKAANKTIPTTTSLTLDEHEATYGQTAAEIEKNSNWNGLGNPTLHYVGLDKTVSVFEAGQQGFNPFVEHDDENNGFVVGTAFFVKGTGTLSCAEDVNGTVRAPRREGATNYTYCVEIAKENASRYDNRLYVMASETASTSFEEGKDLPTLNSETSNYGALIWTKNYGMRLAVEEAPMVNNKASYELGIFAPTAGTYSISVAAPQENAELYLTQNGHIIWNLTMSPCELELTQGQNEGYGLILRANAPSTATGVDEVQSDNVQCTKVVIDDHVYILRGGKMYGVDGKEVR